MLDVTHSVIDRANVPTFFIRNTLLIVASNIREPSKVLFHYCEYLYSSKTISSDFLFTIYRIIQIMQLEMPTASYQMFFRGQFTSFHE